MSALALQELAQAIGREHQAAVSAARSAVEHAIKCGELLLKAKATVGHGGWLAWVETNCTFGQRTAQGYMRLARELPRLDEANAQRVADLSLRDALGTLARQSADLCRLPQIEAVKVLDAADDGDRLRDSLGRVVNGQKHATRQHEEPSEWITVDLPPSLPPPDVKLVAALAREIDSQDLPAMVVLESLNALLPNPKSASAHNSSGIAGAIRGAGSRTDAFSQDGRTSRMRVMAARAVLSFSRDLEFATQDELEKRMGCDARLWPARS